MFFVNEKSRFGICVILLHSNNRKLIFIYTYSTQGRNYNQGRVNEFTEHVYSASGILLPTDISETKLVIWLSRYGSSYCIVTYITLLSLKEQYCLRLYCNEQ